MTVILLQAVLDTHGPATYLPAPLFLPFLCHFLSRVARGLSSGYIVSVHPTHNSGLGKGCESGLLLCRPSFFPVIRNSTHPVIGT